MSKTVFTEAQRTAIDYCGTDLLVSAAAGSGKTATMTERITERITKVNIKESVFTDTDFYAFELIDDLINYVAYRAGFKGGVKYYISSHDNANAYTRMQRYNGEASKGLIPIFINLYSMND